MAKGDDKKNYQNAQANARTQTGQVQQGYSNFASGIADRMAGDRTAADAERAYLTQGYRNIAEGQGRDYLRSLTGGPPFNTSDGSGSSSGGGSGGGGTGFSGDPYGSVRGGFGEFANTGGVDYGAMTESLGGFRNLAGTGGFTDENLANLRRIGSGYDTLASRPIDRTYIDPSIQDLRTAASTGGYDAGRLSQIYGDINGLRNFESIDSTRLADLRAQQGRLSNIDGSNVQTDIDALRRLSDEGYGEFARTGGYSDSDVRNIRARAASTLPAFYSGVSDEMARRNAVTGGYTPGYSSSIRALAKDRAIGAASANRDAELGLQDNIRQGRLAGLGGQATTRASAGQLAGQLLSEQRQGLESGTRLGQELDLALAGNRLRGLEGATEAGSRLEADIANNRINAADRAGNLALGAEKTSADTALSALAGRRQTELDPISISNQAKLAALTGITDTSQGAQRTVQSGRQFGLSGLMGIAQAEEAARQAAASRAAASSANQNAYDLQRAQLASQNERFAMELQANGLGGLSDLYRSAPGQVGMYNNDYLNALGGWNQSIGTGVASQAPQQQGNSWWQNALGTGLNALSRVNWGGGPGADGTNQDNVGDFFNTDSYGNWAQSHQTNPQAPDSYFGGGQYPGGNLPAPGPPPGYGGVVAPGYGGGFTDTQTGLSYSSPNWSFY